MRGGVKLGMVGSKTSQDKILTKPAHPPSISIHPSDTAFSPATDSAAAPSCTFTISGLNPVDLSFESHPPASLARMKYLLLILLDPTHFWDTRWGRGPVDAKELASGERNIYRGTPLEGFQDATPRSVAPPTNQTNQNQSNLDSQVNQGNFGFQSYQGNHVNQEYQRR